MFACADNIVVLFDPERNKQEATSSAACLCFILRSQAGLKCIPKTDDIDIDATLAAL